MGRSFTAQIAGLSQDWVAAQNGWTFDQMFYPASTPNIDATGILYKYAGFINNNNPSLVTYDRVIRVFANSTYPAVEEFFNVNGTQFTPQFSYQSGTFKSGALGAITASTCTSTLGPNGATGTYVPPSSSGTQIPGGNINSGGSSLSGGDIAGIVIGTVVGAFLFCLLCFCLGFYGRNKKGETESHPSTNTAGKYDAQQDTSQVGQSQVEMHPVAGEAETA